MATLSGRTWTTWSGLTTARAAQVLTPRDPADVADAVAAAAHHGLRVKMVGTGHSFTDVAVTDGLLLRPDLLTGIRTVDRDALTVTALAGTPLHVLNARLEGLGLSLHNMGDIAEQTVAGAISTGTHGTGGRFASLSAQVAGLELVTGDGTLVAVSPASDPDLFEAARLGLGAVGVITAVTFLVEPLFTLAAVEEPMPWKAFLEGYDAMVAENHHAEGYWFPGTDRVATKRNNRTLDEPARLSRAREWFDDELMANGLFGVLNRVGNRVPRLIAPINTVAARAMAARRFSDTAHRVFTSPRRVVFREMEYAVPRAAGMAALREARALIERRGWRISFPVEVRSAPADGLWLSTAHDRDTVYLAFHVNAATDHRDYFGEVERLLVDHDGRPHWGKLHRRSAGDLASSYPRMAGFAAVRDRVDPERLFANAYLERVLP